MTRGKWISAFLLAFCLLASPLPQARAAEAVAASPAAVTADAAPAPARGWLEWFNSGMHSTNLWLNEAWENHAPAVQPESRMHSFLSGAQRVLMNFINEPVNAFSWAVAGDYGKSWDALKRFWINTTTGWFGAVDVASAQGLPPQHIDMGLALCSRGVGEGPQIVLPVIGTRSLRDFLADFVVAHGLLYAALAPIIGFPPSLETMAAVEGVEELGQAGVIRQINHTPENNRTLAEVQNEYITRRRADCAALIADLRPATN